MKKLPLPLLMGAVIGTQALLNGVSLVLPPQAHTVLDNLSKASFISSAYAEEAAAVKYTCPMHPQIISDTPGKCPICGMDLVAIDHGHDHSEKEEAPSNVVQDDSGRKVLYWHDPMVPGKKFDKPGKSPFMDMQLVPKYADESGAEVSGGKPVVSISAENIQKMGVRTEKVMKSSFGGGLRATGIIMENERTRWDLFSQVEGRVDELKYSAPGDKVKKGDLFYTLYSPELLALQNDYIATAKAGYKDLAASARKRMKLLGVDDKVLSTLAKTGKAYDSVPFYIPTDGILNRLEIRKGHYLMVNAEIGHIQDLSTVWVEAAIPEKDLNTIKEGDQAKVIVSGSSIELEATVDYIYPTITPETRTGKARLVVSNPDDLLKPAGYATVSFAVGGASEALTVPSSAILRDSGGEHVIVSMGGGKFQAREVKAGMASEGRTEILSGLSGDEDVVVNGQFLIDSESNLRESLNKLSSQSKEASHEK